MIFIFGVVPDGYPLPEGLPGVGDPPGKLRIVADEGLGAVVCDVPAAPNRREDLEAHVRAMEALTEAGTIVPLRFGTLAADDEEVRRTLLRAHAERLRELLTALDGRVQMTLKAIYHDDVPLREIVQRNPALKAAADAVGADERDERIRLGQQIAAAVDAQRADDEQSIAARVDEVAEHVVVEEPAHERMAARLQVLVARDKRAELDAVVEQLSREQEGRMAFRYVGPVAPYSFTDFSLEAEAGAWA